MKNLITALVLCSLFSSQLVGLRALAFTLHAQTSQQHQTAGLPSLVSRATDSISALLSASGRQSGGAQVTSQLAQQLAASQVNSQVQQQQQPSSHQVPVGGANSTVSLATSAKYASNVLEALSNVGKAIQQQIMSAGSATAQPTNPSQIQIMTPTGSEPANTKKNEYQSIVVNDGQQLSLNAGGRPAAAQQPQQPLPAGQNNTNYREQGEQLRQEIVRRAGQLQQVVASSMEVLKNSGDLIVRRLLEQMNSRLDQAKSKADKIINEPATNEMAIKALTTINQGLNNLNNIITNIVTRLDLSAKDANGPAQRVAASQLLEQARQKLNFHQLGQQFSSAFNAAQQQQQQRQQQQPQPQPQRQ